MYSLLPLILGFILDKLLGDPPFLPHPIVGFGKLITWAEKGLNKGDNKLQKGAFIALLFPFLIFSILLSINIILYIYAYCLGIVFNTLAVFFALSNNTLIKEVKAVFEQTEQSLEAGRQQIARIVGRDTSELSKSEIKTAALETLSENLSDGVIAPLFWYLLGGAPAMMAYKMANTLDSMIGYKSERYKDFGRWSARIDDIANYIPARLTAVLMVASTGKWSIWRFVKKYSSCHSSPNAGYPESALAGILNCQFGGGHYYFDKWVEKPLIGHCKREINKTDLKIAVSINKRSELIMIFINSSLITLLCWLIL